MPSFFFFHFSSFQSNSVLSSGCPSTHPLGHPVMEMVRNLRKRTGSDYLGTGSDVFLVNEPCAMCSMALVHFRIKRLFYVRNSKNGVLKDGNGKHRNFKTKYNLRWLAAALGTFNQSSLRSFPREYT